MAIRPLPERCWLLTVDHACGAGDGDEWHSPGGDGSAHFPAVAEVWAHAPSESTPLPLPWQPDTPCLVLSCSGCGVSFGPGEGEHFASEVDALEEASAEGWFGEWCPRCRTRRDWAVGALDDTPPMP